MRLWLAIQCFFKVLFQPDFANRCQSILDGPVASPEAKPISPTAETPSTTKPSRSDAITLLAALQREARFVDIVNESLDSYSDAQIGAAARDVLRDSGKVLSRVFSLRPVVDSEEERK